MALERVGEAARGLFSICVVAAAMGVLARDDRTALSFRAVCALGATVCALRAILRLIGK